MREICLETVDSTQNYAKAHSKSFARDAITCITAETQTAGRGRFNRKWVSPSQNIYATFFFELPKTTTHLIALAQVMAYSFAKILIEESLSPKIKWPNDIQLSGKKVSGILCETQFHPNHVDIFLGIGINVNLDAKAAGQIDQPATSLLIETGRAWDRKALLKKLQRQFAGDLETFKQHGFTPFHDAFEKLLAFKGQTIRCFDGKKTWEGIFHSLTEDGQLNLQLPDHTLHVISSGDVETKH